LRPDETLDSYRNESRLRTTKAMRRLRKFAVREYEVLYRILILGDSIEGVTVWLNERAARNHIPLPVGKPDHYTERDTWALFIAGVDFVRQSY
jgi:hypothetical protein